MAQRSDARLTPGAASPVPDPDPDSAHFWAAALEGHLSLPRCTRCDLVVYYPRARCPRCGSAELVWETLSGSGSIYAFTVVHRAPDPSRQDHVPYVVALIDLDEGPRMLSNIVEYEPDTLRIGTRVSVVFGGMSDHAPLPMFRPADGSAGGG